MPRVAPIPIEKWPSVRSYLMHRFDELYRPGDAINCELKPDTCGYLNGKAVVIDYGDSN
jgi:hypothetical protein